ncbi:hypothetical protein [endosymbiont GvMRE of Glomus versiforme]|uniref:hypothetical protein n=1 Tax=endosymbiont GvMRE of Glomus versiforme TaxID=2039283 RepID=UPI000EEA700A|nr:hypothetical protein [endosymbiont GvMRE of Glomus versiforme]RHZ36961.1 hypothetical protein GvMRE_I2g130 [endosymbiont GvMRE of Glomus versiforme]
MTETIKGNSWTRYPDGSVIGYDYEKNGKIDWFCYQGDSEVIREIKEIIHKFKSDKDYSYSPNSKKQGWELWGEVENYTINNEELKKKLWEKCESNKSLKEQKKALKEHARIMEEHDRIIKEHERIRKLHEKIAEVFSQENNETTKKDPEYVRRYCPNHGIKEVISTDKYCRGCGARLSKAKNNLNFEKEDKNQWKWQEFCVGISVALILFGLVFILVKLFKKKK